MVTFDLSAFEAQAARIGAAADQIPFAISLALNKAAAATENRLAAETWPRHVTARNKGFLKAALKIETASKRNLRVALYDDMGRAALALHAKGGIKRGKGRLAVPTSRVKRGARGVPAGQRPGNLKRKVVKGGLIFQAVGKGKNQRLQLMFTLQPATRVKADVPFHRDFDRFMRDEVVREFPKAMAQAMRTRR